MSGRIVNLMRAARVAYVHTLQRRAAERAALRLMTGADYWYGCQHHQTSRSGYWTRFITGSKT